MPNPCWETKKCIININCDKLVFLFLFVTPGVQSFATTDLEDVVVLRVNAEADNAHVLQPTANVTQMFVEIVGLGNVIICIYFFV